ncbi:MAG TPA: hypothetical protein VII56_04495 [Rhizomicrobium sp.]
MDLVQEIVTNSRKNDDHIIANAMLVREVKIRVESGEVGSGIKWLVWAGEHFKLSKTTLYKLVSIANATDPWAALREFRSRECRTQKAHRHNEASGDLERQALIRLIRALPKEEVRKLHSHAKSLYAIAKSKR